MAKVHPKLLYKISWHNILNIQKIYWLTSFNPIILYMAKSKKNAENKLKKNTASKTGMGYFFNRFSAKVTKVTGGVYAFIIAILVIIVWAVSGPIFNFSDTWQLVINTGTTIITFLMVFIIQHSQNKDTTALQLKLDELIAASKANNELIDVENLDDEELANFKTFYAHLSETKKKEIKNSNQPSIKKTETIKDTTTQLKELK